MIDNQDLIIETTNGGNDTVIAMTNVVMPVNVEVLIVGESASALYLAGRFLDDTMIGNGSGHRFDGAAGDDIILAGGQSLTAIRGLFEGWI